MGFFDRLTELAGGREPSGPSIEEELERARAHFAANEVVDGARLLEGLAVREPRDARPLLLLGDLLLTVGEEEEAAMAFGRAADRAPTGATAWGRLGETLARRGRFEPARDALRRCLALEPDGEVAFRARRALGRLYLTHAQPQRALRELSLALEEAARVDPVAAEEPSLLADRGRAALATGDAGGADWLVRAARAQGRDVELLLEAARAKVNPNDAEALLREAAFPPAAKPTASPEEGEDEEEGGGAASPLDASSAAASSEGLGAPSPGRDGPAATSPAREVAARAALVRHLALHGSAVEAFTLAHELVASASGEAAPYEVLAVAASAVGQFAVALAAAEEAAKRGRAVALATWLAWGFGEGRRDAVDRALAHAHDDEALAARVRRWRDGTSSPEDDLALAALAPTDEGRRFVLGARALPPLQGTHTVALLNRAEELAAASPVLGPLAASAAHAREAFDRPLFVAVMGEFNAGKSTFVNALVGADIAPVGVTPTTATLNVFRHGAPGGRAIYLDGRVEDLAGDEVASFLASVSDASVAASRGESVADADERAASLARTEIFAPVEVLRALEIVDTPGLNALRPVHERLARAFLEEADALVWLFAVDQAAKASEREVLASAHASRKKIVGVVSKADRADAGELEAVMSHVRGAFGPWLEALVPVSAKQARKAQKSGERAVAASDAADGADPETLEASGLPRVRKELERAFLGRARALKTATALRALDRFADEAERRLVETQAERGANVSASAAESMAMPSSASASAIDTSAHQGFSAFEAELEAYIHTWLGVLATERITLRARLDEIWRNGALELATLIEPRAWALGENRARAADEAFLEETLEEGLGRALAATTEALASVGASAPDGAEASTAEAAPSTPANIRDELRQRARDLVSMHLGRFEAYARGVRESGLAAFFRHELPKLRPQAAAFRNALARTVPEVEGALFGPLHRDFLAAAEGARTRLQGERRAAELAHLAFTVNLREPLSAFRAALAQELARTEATSSAPSAQHGQS